MRSPRRNLITLFFCGFLFILAACSFASAGEIAVYGDSQLDQIAQERVVKAILQFKPSIIFRVGDIVNDGNDPEQWKIFNRIALPLLTTTEYYPALGNHEKDSPLYFTNFPVSITNAGIRWKGKAFISLCWTATPIAKRFRTIPLAGV